MGVQQRSSDKRVLLFIGASLQKNTGIVYKSRWKKAVINARVMDEMFVSKQMSKPDNVVDKVQEDIADTKAKDTIAEDTPMALIPCRNFNNGKGSCPFGEKCFFSHIIVNTNTSVCLPVRDEPTVDAEVYFKSLPKDSMSETDVKTMAEKFGCNAKVRFLPENPKAPGRLAGFVNMDKEGAAWNFLKAFDGKHFQERGSKAFVSAKMNHINKDVPQPKKDFVEKPIIPESEPKQEPSKEKKPDDDRLDISRMKVSDIKTELKSLGHQLTGCFKKSDFVDALLAARRKAGESGKIPAANEWCEVTTKKQQRKKNNNEMVDDVDMQNEIPEEWPALSPTAVWRPAIWPGSPMSTIELQNFMQPVLIELPAPRETVKTYTEYDEDDDNMDDDYNYFDDNEEEAVLLSRLVNMSASRYIRKYM